MDYIIPFLEDTRYLIIELLNYRYISSGFYSRTRPVTKISMIILSQHLLRSFAPTAR